MVKSVLGVNHQGLRDWAVQRLSALIIAIYSIELLLYFFSHPHLNFQDWHALFAKQGMKVFTILLLLSIIYHAWAGMWVIFTDYVKPFAIRLFLELVVLLVLAASFIWGILIVWSV